MLLKKKKIKHWNSRNIVYVLAVDFSIRTIDKQKPWHSLFMPQNNNASFRNVVFKPEREHACFHLILFHLKQNKTFLASTINPIFRIPWPLEV